MNATEKQTIIVKTDEKELKKATARGFVVGAVLGSTIVACIKDDSETVKELATAFTTIATSYYGCKFIYQLFS